MFFLYPAIFLLFCFLVILQNSFFAHFNLFGAAPNLAFVLFFLLVFFEKQRNYQIIFYAISAGLFLDLFSSFYLGTSITLLLLIGIFSKKIQSLLKEKRGNEFPFVYFMSLFLVFLIIYSLLLKFLANNFDLIKVLQGLNIGFLSEIIYNLLIAIFVFYFSKRFLRLGISARQLRLFKNEKI